jgi:hypothetical protein
MGNGVVVKVGSVACDCVCRYYLAVCFPQLFDVQGAREYVVERAINMRMRCGHTISVSNPAVLLKLLLEARDNRQK